MIPANVKISKTDAVLATIGDVGDLLSDGFLFIAHTIKRRIKLFKVACKMAQNRREASRLKLYWKGGKK